MPNWASWAHADRGTRAFGGAPCGATERCTGCAGRMRTDALGARWGSLWGHGTLYWACETHADDRSGTLGGAPYEATKR
eukprot:9493276-Pyramimonas_sp.AAC.1